LRRALAALAPLHQKLPAPKAGDWLAEHPEKGQSFAQYLAGHPALPDPAEGPGKRRHLDVQLLGPLTPGQRRVVDLVRDYLGRFYGLPVRVRPELPLSLVPATARRNHPSWGTPQILTEHILDELLRPRLADDAMALLCLTASDLWPGEGWNFVFGQASLKERVGVWSIHRYGDPDADAESFQLALLRALKVAVHETGHMFSIRHCTAYRCVMNGSNSLDESDRGPLWLCPECMAKVTWATRVDPRERYWALLAFAQDHHLDAEAAHFRRSLEALTRPGAL
jgi:archaemetzincin